MARVEDLQTAQIQKVAAYRRAARDNDPWTPQRPLRPTIWVRPTARFPRVLDGAGGFITGPVEVDAGDHFILRRITDLELEIVPPDELQMFLAPPPELEPEVAPPPAAPETKAAEKSEKPAPQPALDRMELEKVAEAPGKPFSSSSKGSF